MIAVVSYRDDGRLCRDITIIHNTVRGQTWGRGISVVGGVNVTVEGNIIEDTSGAGVLVNSDGSFDTYGTRDVRILGNTIRGTDRRGIHHGGIHLEGWPGFDVQNTIVRKNEVSYTGHRGIVVGDHTSDTIVSDNHVLSTAQPGIWVGGGSDVRITDNQIEATATYCIYVMRTARGRLAVLDNILQKVNTSGAASIDVIHVEPSSTLKTGLIRGNRYLAAHSGYERLIECANAQIVISDNSVGSRSGRNSSR
jgi:nitrous oxidase accessory protein NosD